MNVIERFNSHWLPIPMKVPFSECWIWQIAKDKNGYGLFKSLKGVQRRAHRFSWEVYRGEIPTGKSVLHHCDVPSCVNPDHLYTGTNSDNMQDRSKRGGLNQNGERNPSVKLSESDVQIIRECFGSHSDMAKRFCISKTNVSLIRNRKRWKHI